MYPWNSGGKTPGPTACGRCKNETRPVVRGDGRAPFHERWVWGDTPATGVLVCVECALALIRSGERVPSRPAAGE